jgi:uridine kinase
MSCYKVVAVFVKTSLQALAARKLVPDFTKSARSVDPIFHQWVRKTIDHGHKTANI